MAGADDQDLERRADEIASAIANLGVIIGSTAMPPPADDNHPKPEAIGSSGNRDASTD
jgi:hypothetical protein